MCVPVCVCVQVGVRVRLCPLPSPPPCASLSLPRQLGFRAEVMHFHSAVGDSMLLAVVLQDSICLWQVAAAGSLPVMQWKMPCRPSDSTVVAFDAQGPRLGIVDGCHCSIYQWQNSFLEARPNRPPVG